MKSNPRYLTKGRFVLALECPTKLYYYNKKEYANNKDENEFLQGLAEGGFQVGELARQYYPEGEDIKTLTLEEALIETNELLKRENVTIYEAAIKFEDFFIRVDILKKQGNDISLIEVKAKSFNPSNPTFTNKSGYLKPGWKPYLYDVAFQTWVTESAFSDWNVTPYLMMANKNATTPVNGMHQFFLIQKNEQGRFSVKRTVERIPDEIISSKILSSVPVREFVDKILKGEDSDPAKKSQEDQKDFVVRAREYAGYYKNDERFPISVGLKCKGCEYRNSEETKRLGKKSGYVECWTEYVEGRFDPDEPHIFEIWNFRKTKDLMDAGILYMKDVDPVKHLGGKMKDDKYKFSSPTTTRQYLQIQKTCHEKEAEEFINSELFNEMSEWKFPYHFIDFEASRVAIPFTIDRHPYEIYAFQFSCHTLHEDGRIEHDEWIQSAPGRFPNFVFIHELKDILEGDDGTIFRYAAYENSVLREIRRQLIEDRRIEEENSMPGVEIIDPIDYESMIEWIDSITEWYAIDPDSGRKREPKQEGYRNMVDMCGLVRQYYYHPLMKGSNSIKAVLPSVMEASEYLKNKYRRPLEFGTNLRGLELWKLDSTKNIPVDAYSLLPNQFKDLGIDNDRLILESAEIQEGGAAMVAYGKMQFLEMTDEERNAVKTSLLQYCELDTLAMLMIYEHWASLRSNS